MDLALKVIEDATRVETSTSLDTEEVCLVQSPQRVSESLSSLILRRLKRIDGEVRGILAWFDCPATRLEVKSYWSSLMR